MNSDNRGRSRGALQQFGVDLGRTGRRKLIRYCIDWSEQAII